MALTIGTLGRVPPVLGGAGLELQIERTTEALRARGHTVVAVEEGRPDDHIDILHAFGSEPAVWHHLRHWTRNRAPLVVTPIVVISPGFGEWVLRMGRHVPLVMTGSKM